MSAAPLAGWYPDPAGSSALRWWDGAGWTTTLRAPAAAPPAAPALTPAAPAAAFLTAPTPEEPPPFGSRPAVPAARPHAARPAPSRSRGPLVALVVAVVAVLVASGWVAAGAMFRSAAPSADTLRGGQAPVVALKSDVLSIAQAEETSFAQTQAYAPGSSAGGVIGVGGSPVHLSLPGEVARVTVAPSGLSYCAVASRTTTGGGIPEVAVYLSQGGGIQPASVRACPAGF